MDFQYSLRLEKIEAVLRAILPENPSACWGSQVFGESSAIPPEPLRALTAPGRDIINRGGKRWRPLLMTLVCESFGGGDAALPLVPLVELPHNASLIHDDIEDNSDERRGKPAVHLIYGTDTAINGGCFLYFLPLDCIDGWEAPASLKNRIYSVWGEHLRRLHMGQAMDISWHRDFLSLPSPEEYLLMCRLKTGALARLAAVLGVYAALGGTSDAEAESRIAAFAVTLGEAAEKMGVGFQMLDDVKNLTTGNPGKKRGDDIVEGKKSLPILLYLRRRKGAGELVTRSFAAARTAGTEAKEVEELIGELEAAGVFSEVEDRGRGLIREAQTVFSGVFSAGIPGNETAETARKLLAGFTDLIS
jgi:octaprenyl-diphosphate synthase